LIRNSQGQSQDKIITVSLFVFFGCDAERDAPVKRLGIKPDVETLAVFGDWGSGKPAK